jgi:hypothetical protein
MASKNCKIHGTLYDKDIYVYRRKGKIEGQDGPIYIFCKLCKKESSLKWQKNNPIKIKEYSQKNLEKRRARHKKMKYHLSNAAKLSDGYVKNVLHSIYKVKCKDIPPEAVELKREALKRYRAGLETFMIVEQLDKIFGRNKVT